MIRRVLILTAYFLKNFFLSLAGAIFVIVSLVYWAVLFPPGQQTPDIDNYVILIGSFGAAVSFLTAIIIASRANRLENYPFLARLTSRVEYLTAVMISSLIATLILQTLVAALALIRGPGLSFSVLLVVIPVWLGIDIFMTVLALHATDLVTSGWSRVLVYGLLASLLILNSMSKGPDSWIAARLDDVADLFARVNIDFFADLLNTFADWLRSGSLEFLTGAAGLVFWPFRAISDAILQGSFTPSSALAPAVILLYGTILFLIAANLFATKDLDFTE